MISEYAAVIAPVLGPTSVWPSCLVLGLAVATALLLERWCKLPAAGNRHRAIDGLRGYLALGVFLHHSVIWYFYLRSSPWGSLPSRYYSHLGGASVSLFFMITSFLFFSRVLEARDKGEIHWGRLYLSRLFRIAPLYLVSIAAVWLIVFGVNGWQRAEDLGSLARKALETSLLGMFPMASLNGFEDPKVIVAGVYWTLSYEWFFYGILPLLALLCGSKVPLRYQAVALLSALWVFQFGPKLRLMLPFVGGMLVAIVVRSEWVRRFCRAPLASALIPVLLLTSIATSLDPYTRLNIVLLAAVFLLIAGGNSLFGLLEHRVSRVLGELSYGIYLLHGLLLFVTFRLVTPAALQADLPAGVFWLMVLGIAPCLLACSMVAHRCIEQPGIRWGRELSAWLASRAAGGGRQIEVEPCFPLVAQRSENTASPWR